MERREEKEVFIGARSLGKQVKNILPTYDLILNEVEEMKIKAENIKNNNENRKVEHNNVISIFGSRGTGKSLLKVKVIK